MIKQEVSRGIEYLKKKGIKSTIIRTRRHIAEERIYKKWAEQSEDVLEKQRNRKFAKNPMISIVVPLYKTPVKYLKELIDSVEKQTYSNYELCLADGTSEESEITAVIKEYMENNPRIKYRLLEENKGISGNTNEALSMASGEYIALADHDDLLVSSALYEIVRVINRKERVDVIYTDEDKTDETTSGFYMPHFKPDFNKEYFQANNYICHLFVVKREIALETGGFDSEFDGAQDYDFIWKCIEKSEVVYHIPKILYHWRCHSDSTAGKPESKLYAYENGVKVLDSHYKRCGINAYTQCYPDAYGYYKTLSRDNAKTPVTILYVGYGEKKMKTKYPHDTLEIEGYNIKEINRLIKEQNNRYVLIIDKNGKYTTKGNIKTLMSYAMCEDIAVVGSRIYGNNRKLLFGGFIFGANDYFGYAFEGADIADRGYYLRICMPQETLGVCGNSMLIDTEYFNKVGGFFEGFSFNMSVADYCMKIRNIAGKRIVYVPDVIFTMNARRCHDYRKDEIEAFRKRWKIEIEKGDPFYNRNLTLKNTDYSLKKKGIKN